MDLILIYNLMISISNNINDNVFVISSKNKLVNKEIIIGKTRNYKIINIMHNENTMTYNYTYQSY